MRTKTGVKSEISKVDAIRFDKIGVFFKRPILKQVMKILTMEHTGFRTFKSVKNINRLFTNIDKDKYKHSKELESYIWCISFISKQWLDGIVDIDLIAEGAKRSPEYDNIKEEIITTCMNDENITSAPEAKMVFDLVGEALQFGFVSSVKDEYISLLDDVNLDHPGAFRELVNRLFQVSQSLIDIKHNTNMIAQKVTFNTADIDSMKEAIHQTLVSLSSSHNMFKTGIRRLNTLLSPAYMNGRIYVWLGLPGSGKSLMLLKSALDIRKYNAGYVTKTPGMKPCVLYITMENTFTETIERIWNMTFDDSMTNYTEEEVLEKLSNELGIDHVYKEGDSVDIDVDSDKSALSELIRSGEEDDKPNIEIVLSYFSYREISTGDIMTIIQDLRDENMEVCTLVFDYIKRIRPETPAADNVKLELNRIINELKAMAVIQDIPVITAHQMNRAAAATVDSAARQGRGDVTKLVGRENVGDSWEVVETADWAAVLNIEYKPMTEDRYMVMNVIKRRRIDSEAGEFAKYTYLAHPFSSTNGLRLIDDINLDKILSVQSLSSDIDILGENKVNAVPRLKIMEPDDFENSKYSESI